MDVATSLKFCSPQHSLNEFPSKKTVDVFKIFNYQLLISLPHYFVHNIFRTLEFAHLNHKNSETCSMCSILLSRLSYKRLNNRNLLLQKNFHFVSYYCHGN